MPTNKFHYIWMGRLPTGDNETSFKSGPNALAQQLKEHVMNVRRAKSADAPNPQDQEIIMWVPKDLIEGIKAAGMLDSEITLKPVEDLYENAHYLTKEERKNLKKVVELLGKYGAYSAQKDILEAAILEEYAGYYLDTTSEVDSIEQLIGNQPKDIWFPAVGRHINGDEVIPLPDVWAMYNPVPGGGTFKAMLDSYIHKCQYYFPEEFPGVKIDLSETTDLCGTVKEGYYEYGGQGDGCSIMKDKEKRDEFIGQMVVYSLLYGLEKTKGTLTGEKMKGMCSWITLPTEGTCRIDAMGITKLHKGLWRDKASAAEEQVERADDHKRQQTLPFAKDKHFLFNVQASKFKDLKMKYQSLKGDGLKSEILNDFAEKLQSISDQDTLKHFVDDFKKSASYQVLTTRQGLASIIPGEKKSMSQKEVDVLVSLREAAIASSSKERPN